MALSGKLICSLDISKKGDVFLDIFRYNPHEFSAICPHKVHACELIEGDRGAVGSLVHWHYTHEGKKKIDKAVIEAVDEEKQKIVFDVIGGDLVEDKYKTMKVIFHTEKKGDAQVLTVTLEFEKLNTTVPYPTSFMDWFCSVLKDIDLCI
ncbi:kirola [Lactuca sativa]|uniref:Bet v I/Major latex protein domain-containing protein n=1 Tax=Lactuca sativa TaxID=4236 RepID=A0A9R1XAZ0_LACSA|nr:kirola [Lactuca sativa]KAJ0205986.1 hypothetical protein LSAT_V11C500288270 [Lactuca sativa]